MQGKKERINSEIYSQTEDAVLKTASDAFGEVFLPYLGIMEKPERTAPTEMVHLEIKKMYEDFNFQMKGRRWFHFEFESDDITLADLKRFREYEAVTSRAYDVEVTTFVLCTAEAKEQLSEITEGINTYKVNVIHMKDNKAEAVFGRLKAKGKGRVRKEDLVPMLLTPLMGGRMSKKERVLQGFGWLKEEYPDVSRDELAKIQAILYALACKVLSNEEMEEVKGVVGMTLLGQMLMEDGVKKGLEQGVNALVTTCKELGLNREETLEILKKRFQVSTSSASEYIKEYWK